MKDPFKQFKKLLEIYIDEKNVENLKKLWSEPHRYYHTTEHLIQILEDIEKSPSFPYLNVYEKHALMLSAFYHDAIYNPRKKDNEDQSINYFKRSFKDKSDTKMIDKVCRLIETTKHRNKPLERLERIFWEADNAKFKDGLNTLIKIEKQLRKEYYFVSPQDWKKNRIEFLNTNKGLFGDNVDKDIDKLIEYIVKTY